MCNCKKCRQRRQERKPQCGGGYQKPSPCEMGCYEPQTQYQTEYMGVMTVSLPAVTENIVVTQIWDIEYQQPVNVQTTYQYAQGKSYVTQTSGQALDPIYPTDGLVPNPNPCTTGQGGHHHDGGCGCGC